MSRMRYDQQIKHLREDLMRLGSLVELALSRAIKSLAANNPTTAAWIVQDDVQIDYARASVEEQAIVLLSTQPADAGDLRFLNVVTAIAVELERIGDYASIIARRVERIAQRPRHIQPSPALYEMAELTQKMLHLCLEAFLYQDRDRVHSLKQSDMRVDEYEGRLRSELIKLARTDPDCIETVIDLLDVIHALERVANRTTGIGERVLYLITNR